MTERPKGAIKTALRKGLALLVLATGALVLLLAGPASGADPSLSFSL